MGQLPGSIDLAADEPLASWSHIAIFSSSSLAEQTMLGFPRSQLGESKILRFFFFGILEKHVNTDLEKRRVKHISTVTYPSRVSKQH